MNAVLIPDSRRVRFFQVLLDIRPAQLGDLAKRCLGISRRYVRATSGHLFWADPVSVFGLDLLRTGVYERILTELLAATLGPGDTFVDVGANEGYFSVLAASLVGGGRVHAFEPQARLRPILDQNIRVNGSHPVTVHPVALSDRAGVATLYLRPSTNNGASSMFRYWKLGSRREQIATTTLDREFERLSIDRARLMKVDCEGAESLVVAGAAQVLAEHRIELIFIDFHPRIAGVERCAWAHERLTSAGYRLSTVAGLSLYHLPELEADVHRLGLSADPGA